MDFVEPFYFTEFFSTGNSNEFCSFLDCAPPILDGGQIDVIKTYYDVGDRIIVTCNGGMGGTETKIQLTCRENGLFTSLNQQTQIECIASKRKF